jgi:hypothetical protein
MAKSKKEPCFTIEIPLNLEKFQIDFLNKKLESCRKIYNALLNVTSRRFEEMKRTKRYRYANELLDKHKISTKLESISYRGIISKLQKEEKEIEKKLKDKNLSQEDRVSLTKQKDNISIKTQDIAEADKIKNDLLKEYKISQNIFYQDLKEIYKKFNINSKTAEGVKDNLWRAYDSILYGKGEEFHHKRYGTFNTMIGSRNNKTIELKLDKNCITFMGKDYPIKLPKNNEYINEGLKHEIKMCRIVRKNIKKKDRFFVQVILIGYPPTKCNRLMGNGKVGIDIGTQTIAVSSDRELKLEELAKGAQDIQNQLRIINRKMDRSRRATNPDNFNEDGTFVTLKEGEKRKWKQSNNYKKLAAERKELFRKQADLRTLSHETLANEIIGMGDEFYVEDMDFKALQKKAKKTTKNSKGKFNRKKRFGKSLANKAPSKALDILNRKLGYFNKELIKINTKKAKASQYNHVDNTYVKMPLSKRSKTIDGKKYQRDLYAAYCISHINPDLETFNRQECINGFANFDKMHDEVIRELKNDNSTHKVSSLGLKDFSEL